MIRAADSTGSLAPIPTPATPGPASVPLTAAAALTTLSGLSNPFRGRIIPPRRRTPDSAEAAWFVRRYYPVVVDAVQWHVPPPDQECRLTELVFASLLRDWAIARPEKGLEHWIHRRSIAICLKALRHTHLLPRSERRPAALAPGPDADDASARPDSTKTSARATLRHCLSQLPVLERLVLWLTEIEGRSLPEIAELTGFPLWLVRLRAWRAVRRLKTRLPSPDPGCA